MAKELPFYKHEASEWLEGEIQACSDAAIVCFTNLCSGYWIKLGCISYAFALHKYCRRDASILQELIDEGIIDVIEDQIRIKFLDKQLEEFKSVSEKRRQAAEKRWSDASAMQMHSKSNAIREDKKREEENNLPTNVGCQTSDEVQPKTEVEKINFDLLLEFHNKLFGREGRVVSKTVRQKYNARLKEGYTKEQIIQAMEEAKKIPRHIENGFKYLTLEFFSRSETIDKYGTIVEKPKQQSPAYHPR